MGKILYHNITQEKVNETCIIDFIEEYKDGDILYKSESGNACIEKISDKELIEMKKEVEEYYKDEED